MALTLVDLTQAEFEAMRPGMVTGFAESVAEHFGVPLDRARADSARDMDTMLHAGVASPGHLLWKAMDGTERVGFLWISLPGTFYPDMAWIAEVEVAAGHRSRGYGTRMIRAGEAEMVARGIHRIGLHVFGANDGARRLYHRLGYQTFAQVRTRTLPLPVAPDLVLRPMTAETFDAYLGDLITHDPVGFAHAPGADSSVARRLAGRRAPEGVATPGVRLRTAHRADGREVGWLWTSMPTPERPTAAQILYLAVAPEHRRQGHGTRMVAAAGAELAAAGVPQLALSIPGRPEALAFGDSLGMPLTSQQMFRDL
jgi:mycothiol synthase